MTDKKNVDEETEDRRENEEKTNSTHKSRSMMEALQLMEEQWRVGVKWGDNGEGRVGDSLNV